MLQAFERVGIDAATEETSQETEIAAKVRAWEALPSEQHQIVATALLDINQQRVQAFMEELRAVTAREIVSIRILPLYGTATEFDHLDKALGYLTAHTAITEDLPLVRYEIQVVFSNGDSIDVKFSEKLGALRFLKGFELPPVHPAQIEELIDSEVPQVRIVDDL